MSTANPNPHQFDYDPEAGVCYRKLDFLGFPGYRVGDDGSVWSAWTSRRKSSIGERWSRLTPSIDGDGYPRVRFKQQKLRYQYVHHLVLLSFVGTRPSCSVARHVSDPNPLNNCSWNLAWGTQRQNVQDMDRHGRRNAPKGENHNRAKLTLAVVTSARERKTINVRQEAKRLGVCPSTLRRALKGETW